MQILGNMPNCTLNQVAVQLVRAQDPSGVADTVWFFVCQFAPARRTRAPNEPCEHVGRERSNACMKGDACPVCSGTTPRGVYGIEAVQITGCRSEGARSRDPAEDAAGDAGRATCAGPSVQKAFCAITFLAAALKMMLPRAASELGAVAANVTLRLLLMTATGCAPGTRIP